MRQEAASRQSIETSRFEIPSLPKAVDTPSLEKLSMNEMTTLRWSLFDDVAAYRKAGIGAIGLWRPKLSEFGEERGIELVRESGLSVSSLSWIGGFTGANGHSFRDALEEARDAIRIAGELQADSLTMLSGGRSGHTLNHAKRLMVDALKCLCEEAAERNVRLAVQPMHPLFAEDWSFLNSLDETLEILACCNHPCARIAFDVYHLWQEPRLLERIPEIAPLVSVVQLSDWSAQPRSLNDRCLPGDGKIPLSEIVRSFTTAGYQGFFEIGVWSEQHWKSDYNALVTDCIDRFIRLSRDAIVVSSS